jgi:hypothetical protein
MHRVGGFVEALLNAALLPGYGARHGCISKKGKVVRNRPRRITPGVLATGTPPKYRCIAEGPSFDCGFVR